MKNALKRLLSFLTAVFLAALILLQTSYADYANVTGGSGGTGTGTNDNGWVIKSANGNWLFDAEGLRVYLVDGTTGKPVSSVIDITNDSTVSETGIWNNNQKTKYDYRNGGSIDSLDNTVYYRQITPANAQLPLIIPWGAGNAKARIEAVKNWVLDENIGSWLFGKLGITIATAHANAYKLCAEPIAYFRYLGDNYALTATECALLNQLTDNGLYRKMNPLTHQSLPLAMYLENDDFSGTLKAWTGSDTAKASDANIISYLGIGVFAYTPDDVPEDEKDLPPDVFLTAEITAEPDDYEVVPAKGKDGLPCQIGEAVNITVDLKQEADELKDWKTRLEGVSTVTVGIGLRNDSGHTLTRVSAYPDGTREMSVSEFLIMLQRSFTYRDPTATDMIEPNSRVEHTYKFSFTVNWVDPPQWSTAGQPQSRSTGVLPDTASFFRGKDKVIKKGEDSTIPDPEPDPIITPELPPEPIYVGYTSKPTAYLKKAKMY